MVTKAEPVQLDEPDRLAEARLMIEAGMRETIGGSPVASVRRIVLYTLVAIALVLGVSMPDAHAATVSVGIIALVFLALTDKLA